MSTQGGIDWAEVKRRVAASGRALERALTPDPARLEAVYRARAEQLAGRRAPGPAPAAVRVLVCALGTEHYGLEVADIVEVVACAGCTPVPGAPRLLLGVMNVRGEMHSVVDLGHLLGLPGQVTGPAGYVLLARHDDKQVGLRVDQVERIRQLAPAEIRATESRDGLPALRCLQGLTADGLRVLDMRAVLTQAIFAPVAPNEAELAKAVDERGHT